jgi:LemA protein
LKRALNRKKGQAINLQYSLNEVESQIAALSRAYNAAVTDYNNGVETFPNSIITGMSNFSRRQVFEIHDVECQNVDMKDLFEN